MNLIALSLSLFATTCLASDNSGETSPNTSSNNSNYPVNGQSKTPLEQSAYAVGCELAKLEGVLGMNLDHNEISMRVNLNNLSKIVDVDWKENNSIPLAVAVPKLFNMELLKAKVPLGSETIDFKKFRWYLSDCALTPEATIVADVAILKWTVQIINNKNDEYGEDKVVKIDPYDLKVISSLSLTPLVGEDYFDDMAIVLKEIPKLVRSLGFISVNELVYSLIALLKHLQSNKLYAKLEDVVDTIFPSLVEQYKEDTMVMIPLYQEFGFYCVMVLGMDHPFIANFTKYVSVEQLVVWNKQCQEFSLKRDLKIFSLGSGTKLIDDEFHGAWNHVSPSATIGSEQKLEWDDNLVFRKEADLNANQSYLCMTYNVVIPKRIWNEFKSCTSLGQLQKYLAKPETIRKLLIYKISIFTKNFKS